MAYLPHDTRVIEALDRADAARVRKADSADTAEVAAAELEIRWWARQEQALEALDQRITAARQQLTREEQP